METILTTIIHMYIHCTLYYNIHIYICIYYILIIHHTLLRVSIFAGTAYLEYE